MSREIWRSNLLIRKGCVILTGECGYLTSFVSGAARNQVLQYFVSLLASPTSKKLDAVCL